MEKTVEILLTKEIINHFLHVYSLEEGYKLLGDFENYVYEVNKNDCTFILRLTHSTHRELENLLAEIDWIQYLSSQRLNISMAFQSNNGKYVESISAMDGSIFYATLFSKVSGEQVKIKDELFNEQLFYVWGKTIGKMHAVTKTYVPSPNIKERYHWNEDELLDVEKYFPAEDKVAIQNAKELFEQINKLRKNKDNYGLIHSDIHWGNFFYDGKSIYVFDFDDCCYQWFVSDIAIPLYYSTLSGFSASETERRNEFGEFFYSSFIEGYKTENSLPQDIEQQLPLFLMLRDITLYSALNKKIAPEDRNERVKQMLEEIKVRIEQKKPIVHL
ncbi:phosphotransferase enzyme family protein [Cytobacillus dafuensis]|uniref:Phosphotransferase n=1 Tax=Cytobacillus dafuensis TaxID=1742359 RepID=A0A5B8Z2M6_CYTDA|nr:phosphotransferase [Cytobacillus dafuensis]QED47330.1 phosphotransferase [Cytobacillus dafuensis]